MGAEPQIRQINRYDVLHSADTAHTHIDTNTYTRSIIVCGKTQFRWCVHTFGAHVAGGREEKSVRALFRSPARVHHARSCALPRPGVRPSQP